MPFFDFLCEKCGYRFNVRISNKEKEQVVCPHCGARKPRQLISSFSIGGKFKDSPPINSCGGCCHSCEFN